MRNEDLFVVISRAPSVEQAPVAELRTWSIHECPAIDGEATLHFCGRIGERGRVSSPIVYLDRELRTGRTQSGRIYNLIGDQARPDDREMHAVWQSWALRRGVEDDRDITNELFGLRH